MENKFWEALKGLEGRTVKEIRPYIFYSEADAGLVQNGLVFECEDGYTVGVTVDYEDTELTLAELDLEERDPIGS